MDESHQSRAMLLPLSASATYSCRLPSNSHLSRLVDQDTWKDLTREWPHEKIGRESGGGVGRELKTNHNQVMMLRGDKSTERFELGWNAENENDVVLEHDPSKEDLPESSEYSYINRAFCQLVPDPDSGYITLRNMSPVATFVIYEENSVYRNITKPNDNVVLHIGRWELELGPALIFRMVVFPREPFLIQMNWTLLSGHRDFVHGVRRDSQTKPRSIKTAAVEPKPGEKDPQTVPSPSDLDPDCKIDPTLTILGTDPNHSDKLMCEELTESKAGVVRDSDPPQTDDVPGEIQQVDLPYNTITSSSGLLYEHHEEIFKNRQTSVFKLKRGGVVTALKVCRRPETLESAVMWRREYLALRDLRHPHIAQLLAFDATRLTLELEFVGPDLTRYVSTNGMFERSISERYQIFNDIVSAVSFIHLKNIIHLDLKPQNILYDENSGHAKICDFGLAIMGSPFQGHHNGGTPHYLPPEYVTNDKRGSPADMWALGIVGLFLFRYIELPKGSWDIHKVSKAGEDNGKMLDWLNHISEVVLGIPKRLSVIKSMLCEQSKYRISAKDVPVVSHSTSVLAKTVTLSKKT